MASFDWQLASLVGEASGISLDVHCWHNSGMKLGRTGIGAGWSRRQSFGREASGWAAGFIGTLAVGGQVVQNQIK
jgi:hypothetical protein